MVDILLIQPPIRDFYLTAKRTIPYGLASIAAALTREGFSVDLFDGLSVSRSRILDYPPEMTYLKRYYGRSDISPFSLFHSYRHYGYSFEHIGNLARESGAFLVGISSLSTAYAGEALATASQVKQSHPDCRIVMGGHHPTSMPREVMECAAVDYVLRGEGEVSMPMLAKAVRSGNPVEGVPGIVCRRSDGRLFSGDPVVMGDLDAYPRPAMDLIKQAYYRRGEKGSTVVVASRGCPMACTYCPIGSSAHLTYRRKSVKSVIREIGDSVSRLHARFIDFEDEHLSLDREWFMTLLEQISTCFGDAGLELRAMNGLYPPSLDEPIIRAMKRAGFKALNLSLVTSSRKQLRRFHRPDAGEALTRVLDLAGKHGLETITYIIVAAPGQAAEESLRDLLYLWPKETLVGVSVYYPAPDSTEFQRCRERGILPDRLSLMRSSVLPISDTTNRDEAATLLRLGRLINFAKSLRDKGMAIPGPMPYPRGLPLDLGDRERIGIQLLRWFLDDGGIRGVTLDGDIYDHAVSRRLTTRFVKGFVKGLTHRATHGRLR